MRDDARNVGFLLTPAFSILGLAAAIEALFIANWLSGRPLYAWRSLSREGGAVRTSSGLRFAVDGAIAGPASYDAVFVLASFEPKENARDAKTRAWLRRLARYGTELGGIETGSEILAAAGLLDGAEVAVHWDNLQGFREVYPQCHAVAQLFTMSPGRLTCAGESAVLDMMLQWIGGHHGQPLAKEIADHLLLERQRPPSGLQPAPGPAPMASPEALGDPMLARAIALMEQRIEEPLALSRHRATARHIAAPAAAPLRPPSRDDAARPLHADPPGQGPCAAAADAPSRDGGGAQRRLRLAGAFLPPLPPQLRPLPPRRPQPNHRRPRAPAAAGARTLSDVLQH